MMPDIAPHAPGSTMEPASLPLWRIFPPILLPIFLAVVDGTIVASALPAMAGAFGEVERVSWVVASYLVASTVAAPVYGRLPLDEPVTMAQRCVSDMEDLLIACPPHTGCDWPRLGASSGSH